jgi:hypothetical protein
VFGLNAVNTAGNRDGRQIARDGVQAVERGRQTQVGILRLLWQRGKVLKHQIDQ